VAALRAHRARLDELPAHVQIGRAVDPLLTANLVDGVYEGGFD
jgi:hypothetical protein